MIEAWSTPHLKDNFTAIAMQLLWKIMSAIYGAKTAPKGLDQPYWILTASSQQFDDANRLLV